MKLEKGLRTNFPLCIAKFIILFESYIIYINRIYISQMNCVANINTNVTSWPFIVVIVVCYELWQYYTGHINNE